MGLFLKQNFRVVPLDFSPIKSVLDRLFIDLFQSAPNLNVREPFVMLTIICDLLPIQLINDLLPVLFNHVDFIRELLSPEYEKKSVLPKEFHKINQKLKDFIIHNISKAMASLLNRCKDVDYVLRGKIYLFLQNALPIFEKSQLNLLGEFNEGIPLIIDPQDDTEETSTISEGNVGYKDSDIILSSSRTDIPYQNYTNFWKLQTYIRNVKDIFSMSIHSNTWKEFVSCVDEIIHLLKIHINHNDSTMEEIEYSPTNLTNKNLFYFQLRNSSFKRQILSQIIVLCTTLEKGVGTKVSRKQFGNESQIQYVQNVKKTALKFLLKISDSQDHISDIGNKIIQLLDNDSFWKNWKEIDECKNLLKKAIPNASIYSEGPKEEDLSHFDTFSITPFGVKNLLSIFNDTRSTKDPIFLKEINPRPLKRKYDEMASGEDSILNSQSYSWNGLRLLADIDLKEASLILVNKYSEIIKKNSLNEENATKQNEIRDENFEENKDGEEDTEKDEINRMEDTDSIPDDIGDITEDDIIEADNESDETKENENLNDKEENEDLIDKELSELDITQSVDDQDKLEDSKLTEDEDEKENNEETEDKMIDNDKSQEIENKLAEDKNYELKESLNDDQDSQKKSQEKQNVSESPEQSSKGRRKIKRQRIS